MQVLADGRMRLWMGDRCYEVHKGLRSFFEQELASISVKSDDAGHSQQEGNAVTFLGPVTKKLVITPIVQLDDVEQTNFI